MTRWARKAPTGFFLKACLCILSALYLAAAFAPLISPYAPTTQKRDLTYVPPRRLHFVDRQGRWHARPFIYSLNSRLVQGDRIYEESDERLPIFFWVQGEPYRWLGMESRRHAFGLNASQQSLFLLGSDRFGRDVFSRLLHGSQITLTVGLAAIALTLLAGVLVGGVAGCWGGWWDALLMRLAELLLSLPGLFLLLALRAIFPSQLSAGASYLMIVLLFSLVGWASVARVVRGILLRLRNEDYIQAAVATGSSGGRIFFRHLMPGLYGYILVQATFLVPAYMLAEVTLSFLGLGIQEPGASWGNMLIEALSVYTLTRHTWILTPAAFIFIAALCFNFIGDELQAVFTGGGRRPPPLKM